MVGSGGVQATPTYSCQDGAPPVEWQFLQCFGERTPGEEVQEGQSLGISADEKKRQRKFTAKVFVRSVACCASLSSLKLGAALLLAVFASFADASRSSIGCLFSES